MNKVILASKSPRRLELLNMLGFEVQTITSNIDESKITADSPADLAKKLANLKARAVYNECKSTALPVIAADTLVEAQGKILGKPKNEADARYMLNILSGRPHFVHTGLSVIYCGTEICIVESAKVYFRKIYDDEIEGYIRSGEPFDKASGRIWNTDEMIKAGWMDESGKWKTNNGYPPVCFDKAGAYGIQGKAGAFVEKIDGDYYSIMGLPLSRLIVILRDTMGISLHSYQ